MSEATPKDGGVTGWVMVALAALGLVFSCGPVVAYSFSVFFNPIQDEFAMSRGEVSLGYTICMTALAAAAPVAGRLIDRFGAKKILIAWMAAYSAALMGMGLVSSEWQYYLAFALVGVAGAGNGNVPFYKIITNWFDQRRGFALSVSMIGVGLGAMIMPPLAHHLISSFGWRSAYVTFGMLSALLIPIMWRWLLDGPDHRGHGAWSVATHARERSGFDVASAFGSMTFWMMWLAFFFFSFCLMGTFAHLVPMLGDIGITAGRAASYASLMGAATIAGRLMSGYFVDRVPARYVAAVFLFAAAAGILGLGMISRETEAPLLVSLLMLVGLALGAEADLMAFMVSRYFGVRRFSELYAYITVGYILGGAVGPAAMGVSFDLSGNYTLPLTAFAIAATMAAGLMLRLGPYGFEVAAVARPEANQG